MMRRTAGCLRSLLVLLFVVLILPLRAADNDGLLDSFLDAQKKVQTWSAEFVQTRTTKALVRPTTAKGRVWFSAPNQFRWELGNPPQTIAVRRSNEMLIIQPRLKRVEKYPLDAKAAGQWKDMMAILDSGFPRERAALESQFKIISVVVTDGKAEVVLQPKSSSARKMMPLFKIGFSTKDFSMTSTEMQFGDATETMRNDFEKPKVNEALDEQLFSPVIGTDYKVTEPLKK
ncbi:MAG: LolA family protein [Verrucomicrobiales bacterium]|nr:LolA family protein [Verrucomicrobiales bacterium]